MSLDDKAREKSVRDHIIGQLAAQGWLVGESALTMTKSGPFTLKI